jgi:putative hemolysin
MAKKNISSQSFFITLGIFVFFFLIGGLYVTQTQKTVESSILGSTTTQPTKAGAVASAAYAKCIQNGGFVSTDRRGKASFYNICNFADDMNCELYALYNGECPVGGVHTVGYSTRPQVFCALRGGQPTGKNNGQCKMPDGKICSTDSVYKDTCN